MCLSYKLFKSPLKSCFLLTWCSLCQDHGAVCGCWPSTDPGRPRAPRKVGWKQDGSRMAAGCSTPSVAPLHSPSHADLPEFPQLLISIHSPIHGSRLTGAEQLLLSYRNSCKETFWTLLLRESMLKAVKSAEQYPRLPFNRRALPSSFTLLLQSLEHLKLPQPCCVARQKSCVSHGDGLDYCTDFYLQQQAPCISGQFKRNDHLFNRSHTESQATYSTENQANCSLLLRYPWRIIDICRAVS